LRNLKTAKIINYTLSKFLSYYC